jgi:hypothetical protein
MLFRDPRALAFVLLAVGTGLLGWYGEAWYRLPAWSEAEVAQSVELNLALELKQRGPLLQPEGARLEQLRQTLRAEIQARIRRERLDVERWLAAGLTLTVLGLGAWLRSRLAPHQDVDQSKA